MNWVAVLDGGVDQASSSGKYTIYSFKDDTTFEIPILPLIAFPKGITVRITLWNDAFACVPKKAVMSAAFANGNIIWSVESWFIFSNSWIITSEIVLSSDAQKDFYDYIEKNEYASFPCVRVQGLTIDMQQSVSQEVGCMGSWVKETHIIWQAQGELSASATADGATIAAETAILKETNQLAILGGSHATHLWVSGGGKSISYLPKIKKLSLEVGG